MLMTADLLIKGQRMALGNLLVLCLIASVLCNAEDSSKRDTQAAEGLNFEDEIGELLRDYFKQYLKLSHVKIKGNTDKDSVENYLSNKPKEKDESHHRAKRAAGYTGYSSYSAEPYGVGTYPGGDTYSPVKSYKKQLRRKSAYGRSYAKPGNSYYSPSSGSARNSGGRSYYNPQASYGAGNTAYGSTQGGYGNGGYGNSAHQARSYPSSGYGGGRYAQAYPSYGGGGTGGGYGTSGYTDPAYAAQGSYSDPNDPYAGYPDEALTKYLEDILKKSSSEESGSRSSGGRKASVESREASEDATKESESDESKDKSTDDSEDKSKKKRKRKYRKSKSRKSKKRGKKSRSNESDSTEEYDYSEEDLPALTRNAKPLDPPGIPQVTTSPAWFATTPSPGIQPLGMNSPVSKAQAGLLFNELLGNLLDTAMKKRANVGLDLTTTSPSTTEAPLTLYNPLPYQAKGQDIGKELAELGFLIKNTFQKMATRLDNIQGQQNFMKEMNNAVDAVPEEEGFENSRGNAFISSQRIPSNPNHRAERSTFPNKKSQSFSTQSENKKIPTAIEKIKGIKVTPLKRVYKLPSLLSPRLTTSPSAYGWKKANTA